MGQGADYRPQLGAPQHGPRYVDDTGFGVVPNFGPNPDLPPGVVDHSVVVAARPAPPPPAVAADPAQARLAEIRDAFEALATAGVRSRLDPGHPWALHGPDRWVGQSLVREVNGLLDELRAFALWPDGPGWPRRTPVPPPLAPTGMLALADLLDLAQTAQRVAATLRADRQAFERLRRWEKD